MFRTLYGKLSAVLLGLFLLIGALFAGLTLFATRIHLQEMTQRLNRDLARHIASDTGLIRDGRVRQDAARELFRMLMAVHPAIEVYLLSPDGRILAFSAPPGKSLTDRVSMKPVRRFLSGPGAFPVFGDDPRDPRRMKVFSAAPVPSEGDPQGYLYVILGGEEADSVSQRLRGSYILRLSLFAGTASLLFSLLAGLLLFYRLTVRHRRLAAAVEAFQDGGFAGPVIPWPRPASSPGDEIDRLAHAFTGMADTIVRQIRDVRESDARRREMIAHVSHDLRTPLTSLLGYLETLSMKEGLSEPERKEYLAVALSHCRRLKDLVFDLFEMARLDAPDPRIRREKFSLGDLVQDIVMKFRLDAGAKGIRLGMEVPEELPLAFGDIGLLDRVLVNLVGNAVRHTPENGDIKVAVLAGADRLHVEVTDTGHGMSPDRLAGMFEPVDPLAGDPGRGRASGLGLIIARKIVRLHGSDLTARSAPGTGTTFSFDLPVADRARSS